MRARTQEQWKETSPSHRQAKTLSAISKIILKIRDEDV
jgi:hypothetical protein